MSGELSPQVTEGWKSLATQGHFDLLHNSKPTVPLYADGFELLVFGASLTSASLSKNTFLFLILQPGADVLGKSLAVDPDGDCQIQNAHAYGLVVAEFLIVGSAGLFAGNDLT